MCDLRNLFADLFNVESAPVDKLLRPEVHILNYKLELVATRRERHSEDDPLAGSRHQVPATVQRRCANVQRQYASRRLQQ